MNLRNLIFVLALIIPLTITTVGCSRGTSAIIPDDGTYDSMPAISDAGQSGVGSERQLQGIWQVDCNPENLGSATVPVANITSANLTPGSAADLTPNPSPSDGEGNYDFYGSSVIPANAGVPLQGFVIPAKAGIHLAGSGSAGVPPANITPIRTADFHLNVRPFIRTPEIYIKSWNPTTETLDLDVLIKNTSSYHGYDIRLIIFNDAIGHKLLNPDNYTHLWDIPEGSWSNGFKAYAKDNDNRILHSGEYRYERIQILCPGGNFSIQFAIDASWPTNCAEPYMINNFTQGMLQAYDGATSDITVDVYDWQNNVESVRIQASAITGETDTYMTQLSANKWGVELVNNNAVPEGEYFALIAALSEGSTDPLIHLVTVTVSPAVGNGWAQTWGGSGNDYGYNIAVDLERNIIIVGTFKSPTVDFNPDPVEEDIHEGINGYETAFISKFDSHGDFLWAQSWGTEGTNTYNKAVGVNSVGEIFAGCSTDVASVSAYMIKFDPDGNQLWVGHWGDGNLDRVEDIAVDNYDNVIVGGRFVGTVDFDPGPGTDIQTSNGDDPYVIKFDSDCNHIWARHWGGSGIDYLYGVTTDPIGNVISCGYYWLADADFDPGPGTDIRVNHGDQDAFVHKLDANGNYLWVATWGGPGKDIANDCAVDEFGDVYTVGSFYYTVDFDPDPVDVEERTAVWYDDGFVCKLDSEGDFQWVFALGNQSMDEVRKITANQHDAIIVCGTASDVDFNPDIDVDMHSGCYIASYSLELNLIWVSTWKTVGWAGIVTDSLNNYYTTGGFGGKLDFDPGPAKYEITPVGNNDSYLLKILPNGLWE